MAGRKKSTTTKSKQRKKAARKSPALKKRIAVKKARPIAVPGGTPEIVFVECSGDPSHTDKDSHVLKFEWDRHVCVCGCGLPLRLRRDDDLPF